MSQDTAATLLPSSRVDVFALDDSTTATATQLAQDWRFARVSVNVTRAGIEAAIEHYRQNASPELIIVETNDIGEAFIAQLGVLAGVCAAGTDAVIIGPMNDVHLYRNLVGMGVRDYLVRPVAADEMAEVMSKSLIDKKGISGSRLITVTGAKGGVGATSVAQMLAWNIAEHLKQKTILVDAAGSHGSLGIALGVEPSTNLSEGVRIGTSGSEDDLKRIVQNVTEHLSLLIFGGDSVLSEAPDADGVEALVNRLMQKTPIIVMDLSGATPAIQKRMLVRSSHVFVVSTPLLSALRNARALLADVKKLRNGLKNVDFILNMKGLAGGDEVPENDVKKLMDVDIAVTLPYTSKIFAGGEATAKHAGKNSAADAIMKELIPLAERAAGVTATVGSDKKEEFNLGAFFKGLFKK